MVKENINFSALRDLVALKVITKHEANNYIKKVWGIADTDEKKKSSPVLSNPKLVKDRQKD